MNRYTQPHGPAVNPAAESIITEGLASVAEPFMLPLRVKELEEMNEILNKKTVILAEDLLKEQAENGDLRDENTALEERVWALANENGEISRKLEVEQANKVYLEEQNKTLRRRLNGLLDLIAKE